MTLQLGDVQTTALIPLSVKANETKRPNARVKDEMAVKIIEHLGIDTKPYDNFFSHEGVIARTIMLDRMVRDFIAKNPTAVIVNVAAGFDNRFSRVDNGKILWFDMDLPDVIATRKKVFDPQERVTMIEGSALDNGWCEPVQNAVNKNNAPVLFLAEGLFMYFTMEEIGKFLHILKGSFKTGTLIAEQNSPLMVKNQKYHDTVKNTNATFKSGTWSAEELLPLCKGINLVEEHSFNEEMAKYSLRGKLFALLFRNMNDRWAVFNW